MPESITSQATDTYAESTEHLLLQSPDNHATRYKPFMNETNAIGYGTTTAGVRYAFSSNRAGSAKQALNSCSD